MQKGTNQKLKLDMRYTHILYDNPDSSLEVIYMLDKVQKGQGKELSNEDIKLLRLRNTLRLWVLCDGMGGYA